MIAVILAAGYGTRMRVVDPVRPKTLLPVGGRPVIDYLADQLAGIPWLERLILVTNDLYIDQFNEWAAGRAIANLTVLSDGTCRNEDRLGAIGDIQFCVEQAAIRDDLLVAAGDNIFEFPIASLVEFFGQKQACVIPVLTETDPEKIARTANLKLDAAGKIVQFVEKTTAPISDLVCPPLYIFHRETLPLIKTYLDEGGTHDAPGNLIAWLHSRRPVYGRRMSAGRHDIGSPETYRLARAAMDRQV